MLDYTNFASVIYHGIFTIRQGSSKCEWNCESDNANAKSEIDEAVGKSTCRSSCHLMLMKICQEEPDSLAQSIFTGKILQ